MTMYRTVDTSFWTDPKVRNLCPEAKLVFVYLITNPHSHLGGIYYIPRALITYETGIQDKALNRVSDTLSELGLCRFDPENDVVWVVNMFKYQGSGEKNERSVAYQLDGLHKSSLIKAFVAKYPNVQRFMKNTLSDTLSDRGKTVGVQEQEQEQKQESSLSSSPSSDDQPPKKQDSSSTVWIKDAWNTLAHKDLPQCRVWTSALHMAALKLRRDFATEEEFKNAIHEGIGKLNESEHCLGHNDRGWRASLAFLLNANSFAKIMAGSYDGKRPAAPSSAARAGNWQGKTAADVYESPCVKQLAEDAKAGKESALDELPF